MASWYCLIQYMPRPGNDERINVGVVAYDDAGSVYARFLTDWSRVEAFAHEDTAFLRDFVARWDADPWAVEQIAKAREWANSIRVGTPRASTLGAAELLERVAPRMLVEPVPA